jgi:hypothetical protein
MTGKLTRLSFDSLRINFNSTILDTIKTVHLGPALIVTHGQ